MTEDVAEERPAKDTRFDPSRIPLTDAAKLIVADVRNQLLSYESYYRLRQRARKPADQARFDRMVSAIVCDLMHSALIDPEAWRHISLSKRHHAKDGVGAPFMTADRIKIIRWMATPDMAWLELETGGVDLFGPNRRSRIRASARITYRMDEHDIQFGDIGRDPSLMGDPIVLRSPKLRDRAKILKVPRGEPARTFRAQMLRINKWLATAEIDCDYDSEGYPRDVSDRWMRRIFNNGRMDQGGRLYGGFWQAMKAEKRLEDITLSGQSVVSLDFGQCGVRIAYGLAGAQPPAGDLYSVPGLERFREGVKVVLNAMLARSEGMSRKPAGSAKNLPGHTSIREVEEMILRHHHAIRELCYTGLGLKLQFVESQVLVRALLRLAELGVSALPVHDCLLAPSSTADEVKAIMLQAFEETTGVPGQITVETGASVSFRPLAATLGADSFLGGTPEHT